MQKETCFYIAGLIFRVKRLLPIIQEPDFRFPKSVENQAEVEEHHCLSA
jgi:hypothetical protein